MTTQTGTDPAATAPAPEKARYYGFSALVSGFARMWRATVPAVLVIVLNAIVQAGLVGSDPQVAMSATFMASLIGSVVMFLIAGAVLCSGAYEAASGRVSFGSAFGRARRNFLRFTLWVGLMTILVVAAATLNPVVGIVVAWVLVYVPIAAVDDRGNPFASNFAAIGRHPFRWIFTALIIAILLAVGFLLGAFNTFLIGGFVGSLLAMLIGGLFSWWYLTTWACLYRSRVGDEGAEPSSPSA